MTKEKRTRRLCASLALTVLASTTILTGMAPVVAHAEGEAPGEATSSVLVTPSLDGAANDSAPVVDVPAVETEAEAPAEVEKDSAVDSEHQEPAVEIPGGEDPAVSDVESTLTTTPDKEFDGLEDTVDSVEKTLPPVQTSGTWGTVEWVVTLQGELILKGGTGSDTGGVSPWAEYANQIKEVNLQGRIVAPAYSGYLFANLSNVEKYENLDLLDTSGTTNMYYMFGRNERLMALDVSSFDVSNVLDMEQMFENTWLISVDLSNWYFNPKVSMRHMFTYNSNLREVDLSNAQMDKAQEIFFSNANLERLSLGAQTRLVNIPVQPGQHWAGRESGHTFVDYYDGGHDDTYDITPAPTQGEWGSVAWYLHDDGTLVLEAGSGANTENRSPWMSFKEVVNRVVINGEIVAPSDLSALFKGFRYLTTIEHFERLDVSQVENMSNMFSNNTRLAALDVSHWNTGRVKEMGGIFANCGSLRSLSVENWDMRAVESLEGAFYGDYSIKDLSLSGWELKDGVNISGFLSGTGITEVDLSQWNTKDVVADYAFQDMSALKRLDISGISIKWYDGVGLFNHLNDLETIVIGEDTHLTALWVPEGQLWTGEKTGHQFGRYYNSGYADTYRLSEGEIGYLGFRFLDSAGWGRDWQGPVMYGLVGEEVDLTSLTLPEGYELQDSQQQLTLLPLKNNGAVEYQVLQLKQIPKTTTRRITFTGLPEGKLEDVIQEVEWTWEWNYEDINSSKLARMNIWGDYGFFQVFQPLSHYQAYTVPTVAGYKAEVTTVAAHHFNSDEDITELNNADDVTVHFTKLSTDGGDTEENNSGGDANNGNGETGGGNLTGGSNLGSGAGVGTTSDANNKNVVSTGDNSLPQTGSVAASGLATLGLGLLGLLGINWRKRRRS